MVNGNQKSQPMRSSTCAAPRSRCCSALAETLDACAPHSFCYMQEPEGSNQEVDMLGITMTALHKSYNGDLGKMKADFAKKFAGATLEIKVRT